MATMTSPTVRSRYCPLLPMMMMLLMMMMVDDDYHKCTSASQLYFAFRTTVRVVLAQGGASMCPSVGGIGALLSRSGFFAVEWHQPSLDA